MARYKINPSKIMSGAEQVRYFGPHSDTADLYTTLRRYCRVVETGEANGYVNVLNSDGSIANDGADPKNPCFEPGQWRSRFFSGFPVDKLVYDEYLVLVAARDADPAVKPAPRVPVKVDNRRNDGPCPVCGTRTEKFSCFTSVSFICPQCKG